jgi:hypothetical protein
MDLASILKSRLASLPDGPYSVGLKAVQQHVEVAERHLARGQTTADETAFTDAIYRTNQAFEGSLKEAYRVLAGKDPSRVSPSDIENYFQGQSILRPRVLSQFTVYRQEWRNPSTHDYRLEFDEDEALLAIVSVSAFGIVLIDQIAERLFFERARMVASAQPEAVDAKKPLIDRAADLIERFVIQFNHDNAARPEIREREVTGALAGFLSKVAPDVDAQIDTSLAPGKPGRLDLLLGTSAERLIVEVKLGRDRDFPRRLREGVSQVSEYMDLSGIKQAILFGYVTPNNGKVVRQEKAAEGVDGRIVVIFTKEPE